MVAKVAIVNRKGGVGKSTLAVNLAWEFTDRAEKVLVVDLDPQFNASQYLLGVHRYENIVYRVNSPTVWSIFEQFTRTPENSSRVPLSPNSVIQNVTRNQSGGRLDLIPAQLELADTLRRPAGKDHLLARFISEIENKYDLILFDCSPTESLFTISAYLASDHILVPVKPEYLSTIGLNLLVRSMDDFHDEYPDSRLSLAGIVFNTTSEYLPEEGISKREVRQIAYQNGWYVFHNEISYSRSYPKGARENRPISRTSNANYLKKYEFITFADEFAIRVGI